jgi:hypothetical protein
MKTQMLRLSISILTTTILVVSCAKDNKETVPAVKTLDIFNISATTASVNSEVTSDGYSALLSRGICWDTVPSPTIESMKTSDTLAIGIVASQMSGLTPNKTYYVRGYVSNAVGVAYGEEKSVRTLISAPTVSMISLNVYNGRYGTSCVIESTGNGTIIRKGFCMSKINKYPTVGDNVLEYNLLYDKMFLLDISDYYSGYYIRAFATNEAGTGYSNVIKHCRCIDNQNHICDEENCTTPTFL